MDVFFYFQILFSYIYIYFFWSQLYILWESTHVLEVGSWCVRKNAAKAFSIAEATVGGDED